MLLFALLLGIGSSAPARSWTYNGETIVGEYVSRSGRHVTVKLEDGTEDWLRLYRLDRADREWIDRYHELTKSRRWGRPTGPQPRGGFESFENGKLRVAHGDEVTLIYPDELTSGDLQHLRKLHLHIGATLPADLANLTPPVDAPADAPRAEQREWVDVDGRTIEASFVRLEEEGVVLLYKQREVGVRFARLSSHDLDWLHNQPGVSLPAHAIRVTTVKRQTPSRVESSPSPEPEAVAVAAPRERFATPRSAGRRDTARGESNRREKSHDGPAGEPGADFSRDPESQEPESQESDTTSDPPTAEASEGGGEDTPDAETDEEYDEYDDEEYSAEELAMMRKLDEAFGDAERIGIAECYHCDNVFDYPAAFGSGDSCPFCGKPVGELITYEEIGEALAVSLGGGRPWYLQRWFRRLAVALVIAVVGGVIKAMMGD
ncbi:hypothetical protein Mal64_33860 [Pseudobythopirellula maris]|uniref:SLA1 homology domain-containing protein n=1 Tax=Pseudobythopirellula maris TaxID=2527991 RepID=A0A5C5ZHG5_9BACT|nr:hypothetical protein [Pseudobythopirellula maris]TWT86560.1 hypothetical protein Mal64_33860 [Pseudobythopirellula maris]